MKSRNPKIEFDELQMYFGLPYTIDLEGVRGKITLLQPSIGDIIRMGQNKFYHTLNTFITNTTANRLMLHEAFNEDWNEISDYEFFCKMLLTFGVDPDVTGLLFDNIDFSKFKGYKKTLDDETEVIVLYNDEDDIEINEEVYWHISQYFREMFKIFPEEKITKDSIMKKWFLQKDKRHAVNEANKEHKGGSMLPVISACLNHPGFKYKKSELMDVGVCEFYDSVQRLNIYENATAVMRGLYSGFVDGKKIKPENYNFMRDIKGA